MTRCPRCQNFVNSSDACEHCGQVLDDSLVQRAQDGSAVRAPTVVESGNRPRPTPPPLPGIHPSAPPPRPASGKSDPPAGRRGETALVPPSAPSARPAAAGASPRLTAERKVVAVLVTYSWKPQGQVFPVREGRNLIGRGEQCDICVAEDATLSDVNSHVTFRQSFVLGDMVSMSGTDLNGEPVEEQFRPLENYARIRTGSTQWIFVIVDSALASRDGRASVPPAAAQ